MLALLCPPVSMAAPVLPAQAASRPHTGIGVLYLAVAPAGADGYPEPIRIYEEPAINRLGELDLARLPSYPWLFGPADRTVPLVVTARKGNWLRVVHDDAGREAWLAIRRRDLFQSWDELFGGQAARLLAGLQKRYYQLFRLPGGGLLSGMTAQQTFRVVRLDGDWALVEPDRDPPAWLRWRDDDGRLLIRPDRAVMP